MLTKRTLKTLLILGITAAPASAQSPLWFDPSTVTAPKAGAVEATKQPSKGWVESNKIESAAIPTTERSSRVFRPTAPTRPTIQPATIENWATIPLADAQANTTPKSKEIAPHDLSWAMLPVPALPPASSTANQAALSQAKQSAGESADEFLRRAERALYQPTADTARVVSSKRSAATPSTDSTISTQLSSRALHTGEVESEFKWPHSSPSSEQVAAASNAASVSTAVTDVVHASDESLITDAEKLIASWQQVDDDDKPAKTNDDSEQSASDAASQDAAALKEAMAERDEAAGSDKGDDSDDGSKFNTASMVGPMAYAPQLFSKLEIQESFQGYAERVGAMRTRDLDSPMQAPYTFETYTWISPVFHHKPLYFEQPNLERYGQGTHRLLQPAASSVHFFGTIPLLPYKILTQHPCEKYYTLGNRRPGNCNPVQRRVIPGQSSLFEVREYYRPGSGY